MLREMSPKQALTLLDSDTRINVWVGAVRSGKSYSSLWRFIEYIMKGPKGDLMIIGKSNGTIKRNIISELMNFLGVDVRYYEGKQELHLWGRKIHIVGASDERAVTKIQGATLAGAYVDELTLIPQSFWQMLLSRLSISGAQVFATTNPDSPYHWVKTELLDRAQELNLKTWHFILNDNPSLDENYKINLEKEYKGLWYQRYIEGKWVLADGVVYDCFDESLHVMDFKPSHNAKYYIAGVDYGTANPCAFTLLGVNADYYPNFWVEKEYYWDSKKKNRQKTDTEYAADLKKFISDLAAPIKAIYLDPSAASFKTECFRQKISPILDANNDVLDGIRFVSGLLSNGTLKVTRQCPNLIKEFGSYVWDTKASERGEDRVVKKNDHCFAAGTQIRTETGLENIESIKVGDKVLTPLGFKKVLKTFSHEDDVYGFDLLGKKIKCTEDHKFFTADGWKEIKNIRPSDMFLINIEGILWDKKLSFFKESNIEGTYLPKINPIEDISRHIKQIALKDTDISIEMYGNSIMGKLKKEVISITSMAIPQTMKLSISSVYQLLNTYPIIREILQKHKEKILEFVVKKLDLSQNNGIPDFVRITVNQNGEEIITLTMRLDNVSSVIKSLDQTNIPKNNSVPPLVEKNYLGKEKVYNLMIEDIHTYFAEDILVSNCCDSLRYMLFSHFGKTMGDDDAMTIDSLRQLRRQHGYW